MKREENQPVASHPPSSLPSAFYVLRSLASIARDVKLAHSVFALPFAVLGAVLAAGSAGRLVRWGEFALVVVAMVFARTMAMTFNRAADAAIDADNPRTAGRAIPRGEVRRGFAFAVSGVSAAGLVAAAGGFWWFFDNPWPVAGSPIVIAVLCGYSLAKRFTAAAHLVLGLALGISPVAAALAVEPAHLASAEPWLLMLGVLAWVAGFDVIYALQDEAFDRAHGLFSIPARLGTRDALRVSAALHAGALALLVALWHVSPQLGVGFAAAVAVTATLIVAAQLAARSDHPKKYAFAFFATNAGVSVALGVAGIVDVFRNM